MVFCHANNQLAKKATTTKLSWRSRSDTMSEFMALMPLLSMSSRPAQPGFLLLPGCAVGLFTLYEVFATYRHRENARGT